MECLKVASAVCFLWTLLTHVASQNLIKNSRDQKTEHQLLINEVNADNPGLDTSEFVELYHTSGRKVPLDGYFVVFYNGKFNTAYKVLNLNGFFTDERGFFLVGSSTVTPSPSVVLAPNTIQNGPDAIALYQGMGVYRENMRVISDGLIDALVHKSKDTDKADVLISVLTPGREAFLEDPLFRITDESIERCLGPDSQWTFQVSAPSPGKENHCGSSPTWNSSLAIVINEVSTVSSHGEFEFVELQGPPSAHLEGLVLVLLDGKTKQVYFSMDIQGKTSLDGLFLIGPAHPKVEVNQLFPTNASKPLLHLGPDAVALYIGNSSSFLPGSAMTVNGLVDALVYTSSETTDPQLLKVLTPGRYIFYENQRHQPGDESMSRCSCCNVVRDSSVFVLGTPTPGQVNECPKRNFSKRFKLCLEVADCTKWISSQASYEIHTLLARTLDAQCNCGVSVEYFKDSNLTCQGSELVFETRLLAKSAPQLASLSDAFTDFLGRGGTVYVGGRNTTMEPACFQGTGAKPSGMPDGVSRKPEISGGTDSPPVLLITEVNPDNPGGRENEEFVELFHPGRRGASLDGYWVVLFNGKNGLAYEVVKLFGYRTNAQGYFLLGSSGVVPRPDIVLPANTIQNGADAVALYFSRSGTYRKGMAVTEEGLVDAVVYQSRGSEKADRLLSVLTPGQEVLHEDEMFNTDDESLSRCDSLRLRDQSSFQVTNMTPSAENACRSPSTPVTPLRPSPPESQTVTPNSPSGLVINELSLLDDPVLYQFIELKGVPNTILDGHSLVFFQQDGHALANILLKGRVRVDGLYVIGLDGMPEADSLLPRLRPATASGRSTGAVALYLGEMKEFSMGVTATRKHLVDAVVYTWDLYSVGDLLNVLGPEHLISYSNHRTGPLSLSRCSCCHANQTLEFAESDPTPGLKNICPQQSLAVLLDICLQNISCTDRFPVLSNNQEEMRATLSTFVNVNCSCGFSQFYIQGLDFTCDTNRMKVSISAWARTVEQQTLIQKWYHSFISSHHQFTMFDSVLEVDPECATPLKAATGSSGSFQAWELSLIILASLLVIAGGVAFFLYYIRRRPQNYTTIEMNNQRETSVDF
ncbi:uncharacterized protein LOC144784272 [Lissotriton helveticus]